MGGGGGVDDELVLPDAASLEEAREGGRRRQEARRQLGPTTLSSLGIFKSPGSPLALLTLPASQSPLTLLLLVHIMPAPMSRALFILLLPLIPWIMPSSVLPFLNQ